MCRTVRVWDIETQINTKIMSGHTNWVWDCCEFKSSSGEYRALSVRNLPPVPDEFLACVCDDWRFHQVK